MSKKVFVLVHDYWHHDDSIKPMMDYLFNADYEVTFTKNPNDYFKGQFDLFLSFKDPIENDQIPTPIWCDEKWTEKFLNDVQNGMGTIMLHASLTDYTENHAILTNVVRSNFITHPKKCPLTVKPIAEHPIIEGIGEFTFPDFDEHYVMKMIPNADTTILAETVSKNGVQPAVWIHTYGKGKICCIVPAHTTQNLTYEPFVKLVKNAIDWVQ